MSLPRYPAYRDSGVAWLGQVPQHWPSMRLRRCVLLNPSKSEVANLPRDLEVSFLPMEAIGEDGQLDLSRTRQIDAVETGYTYFRDGDVVFAKITPCFENGKGALMQGLAEGIGFGTTELIVLRADSARMLPTYLDWLVRSPEFRDQGEASMYGAGGQKRVPDDFVRELPWAIPSIDEQIAIATFLDRETAKIDALIAEQEKLIALLAEKRQSTISHAVTRGLNPSAPMKDSGVPWLGEVPAHWEIWPLKHLVGLKSGGTPSKERLDYWTDGAIPWASAKDLKFEVLHDTADHLTEIAMQEGAAALVEAGAALVVVRGMILARTFPVTVAAVPMAINQDLKAVTAVSGITSAFLPWLLRGTAEESLRRLDEAGHGTKALRMDAWLTMMVPVPPVAEQGELTSQLIDRLQAIDELLVSASDANELLRERRSALIAAAVTGQIDVRGLVAA